jgi:hypothetical protein
MAWPLAPAATASFARPAFKPGAVERLVAKLNGWPGPWAHTDSSIRHHHSHQHRPRSEFRWGWIHASTSPTDPNYPPNRDHLTVKSANYLTSPDTFKPRWTAEI